MLKCSTEGTTIGELAYQPHAEVIIQYKRHRHTPENNLMCSLITPWMERFLHVSITFTSFGEGGCKGRSSQGPSGAKREGWSFLDGTVLRLLGRQPFLCISWRLNPTSTPPVWDECHVSLVEPLQCHWASCPQNRVVLEVPFLIVLKGIDFSGDFSSHLEAARQIANLEKYWPEQETGSAFFMRQPHYSRQWRVCQLQQILIARASIPASSPCCKRRAERQRRRSLHKALSGSARLGRIAGDRGSQNKTVMPWCYLHCVYLLFFGHQRTTFRSQFSSSTV